MQESVRSVICRQGVDVTGYLRLNRDKLVPVDPEDEDEGRFSSLTTTGSCGRITAQKVMATGT